MYRLLSAKMIVFSIIRIVLYIELEHVFRLCILIFVKYIFYSINYL